ncbi:MAG: Fic family protein [Bacteroidales bacterium]|jgi:Fic family protein|nr:Fic family protein [Bacteroidales bacterium]
MLERPPKPTKQENQDAFKLVITPEIHSINAQYPYWDKVKYIKSEGGANNRILWFALKLLRQLNSNKTDLEFGKYRFCFMVTDEMFELLHYFDMNIGSSLTGELLIPSENKNAYLISSVMEEAIASSQMEGATTTRKVAKDMLRKSEKPKSKGQQMILNNYLTINHIKEISHTDFSIQHLLEIHRSMTENTLDDESDAGKIRGHDNIWVMDGITGDIAHIPPHYEELNSLLFDMEKFFNKNSNTFIHPIVKGIIVHFMLAYFHPFIDGNGRTARSLFYWYMLKNGYWLVEYMSISRIIYKTKKMYEKSFLYTEYDDNDLTYFILYNLRAMKQSIEELKLYLKRKTEENNNILLIANTKEINIRQAQILKIVHEKSNTCLSVKEIENRFSVSNFTARTDLEGLVTLGYLSKIQLNKIKRSYIKSDRFDSLIKGKL